MADSIFPQKGVQAEKGQSIVILSYVKDLLDMVIRRKWLIIIFVILGITVGGTLAWLKKDVYRSSTVILVEQQKIHQNYVADVVGGSAAERVSAITQTVLSRTSLQKMIDEFQLSPETIQSQGYQPVIEDLRTNIKINASKSGGRRGKLETLTISFAHQDPLVAMKVTSKLASQFIDGNIKMREQFIEGATEFFDQELIEAKKALDEKERLLSEYKLKYLGELPGQLDTNLRTLDRLQLEKIRIQETLNDLNSRLELLQQSIRDYDSNPSLLQGQTSGKRSDPSVMQLSELKKQLQQLTGEFTEAYPDVVSLKLQIRTLEEEMAKRGAPASEGSELERVPFDPYLAELKAERNELKLQKAQLTSQLKRTTTSMADYEGRIERTPEREQELLGLERNYGNMVENYQHLHQKQINANISENLDKRQKGERFRILDPANLPSKPEGLGRELIALVGLAGGVGLGLGLAFLSDLLSPTFRRSDDVEVSLGFPLLATIPSFKMVYGKSMKMLPGAAESSLETNGKTNIIGKTGYSDIQGTRKSQSVFSGRSSATSNFPKHYNLITKWRPESVVAEQFRVAATRLDLLGDKPMGNVVLISSAMQGEGKTSTAGNLAYTLALDLDEPTLVIDCDYKRPNLHNVMSIQQSPGVADYLAGEVPLESCFQKIQDLPLWSMAVGNLEANQVSLSKLQHLSSLLESVKTQYRFIILDGPPILPLADINVLSGLASIVLMVVRSGVTPKDVVQKATDMVQGSHVTRMVLTDAWSEGVPYYVRHGYYAAPYALSSTE